MDILLRSVLYLGVTFFFSWCKKKNILLSQPSSSPTRKEVALRETTIVLLFILSFLVNTFFQFCREIHIKISNSSPGVHLDVYSLGNLTAHCSVMENVEWTQPWGRYWTEKTTRAKKYTEIFAKVSRGSLLDR